jgi:Ca2+:H+ antiporter
MRLFKRKTVSRQPQNASGGQEQDKMEKGQTHEDSAVRPKKVTPGIQPDGESGRSWFHPWHFLRICWRSSSHTSKWTNILWPFTIAAIILYFGWGRNLTYKEPSNISLWVFITAYIGMVPAANLVGFGGQELARKIPKVMGVILETTFGSIVEIILFLILLIQGGRSNVPVIQAAILGSILANLLLCLGMLTSQCIHSARCL